MSNKFIFIVIVIRDYYIKDNIVYRSVLFLQLDVNSIITIFDNREYLNLEQLLYNNYFFISQIKNTLFFPKRDIISSHAIIHYIHIKLQKHTDSYNFRTL